jgi:hypothetical protein
VTNLKIVAIIILSVVVISFLFRFALSEKGYKGPQSDHFNGQTFENTSGRYCNGLREVFKYLTTRKAEKWTDIYESYIRSEPLPENESDGINITFVNHSTFIIQYKI